MYLYHRRHRDQKYHMQSNSRKTMHNAYVWCMIYCAWCMVIHHKWRVSKFHCFALRVVFRELLSMRHLICMVSDVQTGCTMPTQRFSDTLLVAFALVV